MEQEDYFWVNRVPNRVDRRVAGEQASCYVVNLAFAGLEGLVFSQAVESGPKWNRRSTFG
jgi:hypothetical protein